jgi:Stage II sporulation protein E (SpoIIE)
MHACFVRLPRLIAVVAIGSSAILSQAEQRAANPITAEALNRGAVALDGSWKFHTGDNPDWATQATDDSDWEELSADRTWGEQGHENYTGFAWYRRTISFISDSNGSGDLPALTLLVPHVDGAYELHWNGVLVGRSGKLPPFPTYSLASEPPRTFDLRAAKAGVLAFRVWKAPPMTDATGTGGGFDGTPMIGSAEAIQTRISLLDYQWLRTRQFYFAVNLLYGMVALLSLIAWLRNRSQWPFFWMAWFALAPILSMILYGLRLPISLPVANGIWQPVSAARDIALWFLLLWLFELRDNRALVQLTRICAWADLAATVLDGIPPLVDWVSGWTAPAQAADAVLTGVYVLTAGLPVVIVIMATLRRERRDAVRWLVAIFAFVAGMIQVADDVAPQGRRYTHWNLADRIDAPVFTLHGNAVTASTLAGTLLLIMIVYAVYRSSDEARRRQETMEQEFRSARALQQVLIPETHSEIPGFALTSAYLPAHEVGGDFFQLIPMGTEGATLVVLGDVSGKGLKAAMAVSFIVGAVRALASLVPGPAQLLTELNDRLCGRLQGGFATCLAMRVDRNGGYVIASAGHPPPYINKEELELPGAFPLGLVPSAQYEESAVSLATGDHCILYTDGLLEARSETGELFGFERLGKLFAGRPNAAQAAAAAVKFGQDDDITVLTLTRVVAAAAYPASKTS